MSEKSWKRKTLGRFHRIALRFSVVFFFTPSSESRFMPITTVEKIWFSPCFLFCFRWFLCCGRFKKKNSDWPRVREGEEKNPNKNERLEATCRALLVSFFILFRRPYSVRPKRIIIAIVLIIKSTHSTYKVTFIIVNRTSGQ